MVADRHRAVRALVADEPALPDDRPALVGQLQRLCRAAERDLPGSGVGVSVGSTVGGLMTAAASSATSARIEELQFSLGEGPCLDAFSSRSPVLVSDLSGPASTTWPGYGPAARERGVRAVFAFPLQFGAARLGALDVYRETPGELSSWALSRALSYAAVATQTMLEAQQAQPAEPGDGGSASLFSDPGDTRFEVYQAQGMVSIQLDVSVEEALARIRGYSFANDRRLAEVAKDVIARRLRLEPDGPHE